jgi:hypothetical protein
MKGDWFHDKVKIGQNWKHPAQGLDLRYQR